MHITYSDKPVTRYSLDVIISVGYRVKSLRGDGLASALATIEQGFGDEFFYPNVASLAAHLFYFVIKKLPAFRWQQLYRLLPLPLVPAPQPAPAGPSRGANGQ